MHLIMEKSKVLDNQQERLAFLAGMIEGEGTVTISRISNHGYKALKPMVQIANSNPILIEHVAGLVRSLGVSPYVYWRNPAKHQAPSAVVRMEGFKRAGALLRLVTPFLISKKPQAEAVLRYISRREGLRGSDFKTHKLGVQDVEEFNLVKELNLRPMAKLRRVSSETTR